LGLLRFGKIYLGINGDESIDSTEIEQVILMGIIIGIVEEMIVGQAIFFREIGEK
jgi:hypothetical protein